LIAQRHLAFALDGEAPPVHGSPWMAGELVRNLLANAIRHSPVEGQLGIRFERASEALRMVVWDSGPGIDEAMRTWLFQPFASTKGVAGAGLGLAICLDIATAMGARIALNNRCAEDGAVLGLDAIVSWDASTA
jgi:two-component system, OmpR family, sensor histidine kinase TctE